MERLKKQLTKLCEKFYGDAAIVVKDLQTGEKIDIRGDERFHVASIIKMWPLYLFLREAQEGKRDLNEKVVLTIDPAVRNMGISDLMHPGIEFTYRDLLTLMIVLSDNHCTNRIIDTLTIEKINAEIQRHGARDTMLNKKMNASTYNWSTGNDVCDIFERVMTSDELTEENRKIALSMLQNQRYNTKLPVSWRYATAKSASTAQSPAILFRHKTGEFAGVEDDAGVLTILESGKDVVIVCMTKELVYNNDGIIFNNKVGELVCNYFI